MTLSSPSPRYDPARESERNRVIEDADRMNWKRNGDMELVGTRIVLRAPDGGRWAVVVDNAGVLSCSPA